MNKCKQRGFFVVFVTLSLWTAAFAVDKSGVTPNTISIPSGPGSIEGLGESFEPTLHDGTAKYAVPLALPPGTAGQAPKLSLAYSAGGANGSVGFGWTLPTATIQRRTDKGIPLYVDANNGLDDDQDGQLDESDEIDTFINGQKEELVPLANGDYFSENESAFIRYRRNGDHWEGTLPNGTTLLFGLTSTGRVEDVATGHIFKWLLEKQIDVHGNTILYTYDSVDDEQNTRQKYLSKIQYGPGASPWTHHHWVQFDYEPRSDWFEDGRAGFLVRTGLRLKE